MPRLVGAFANNSDCRLQLKWAVESEQDTLRWRQCRIICLSEGKPALGFERIQSLMQNDKERVALGSIAASGGLTIAKRKNDLDAALLCFRCSMLERWGTMTDAELDGDAKADAILAILERTKEGVNQLAILTGLELENP